MAEYRAIQLLYTYNIYKHRHIHEYMSKVQHKYLFILVIPSEFICTLSMRIYNKEKEEEGAKGKTNYCTKLIRCIC